MVEAMAKEGLTKQDLGREGFLERAWDWKNRFGSRIVSQLKKLGSSCDWQRERFTMDEGCSEAVREVFVRLYNEGLIYRGNRMVNWCPTAIPPSRMPRWSTPSRTATSGICCTRSRRPAKCWSWPPPVPRPCWAIPPLAINAEDPRYAHLHGCHEILPLLNKEIPIVCDEHADMTKGTGVVKITPAHDPNDFEVGLRHNLPIVRVFTYDGHMTGAADKAAADALLPPARTPSTSPRSWTAASMPA